MLTATVIRRLEALGTISQQGKRLNGLFRLMENPILWHEAYANIYSNDGALTQGVDEVTLDGFSHQRVTSIIARRKRRNLSFQTCATNLHPQSQWEKATSGSVFRRRQISARSGQDDLGANL